MEIVIKIPENTYEATCNGCMLPPHVENVVEAIKNGKPLPKGHGRLIDADSIHQIIRPIEQSDAEWGMTAETAIQLIHSAFNKAPTIIERSESE